MGPPRPIVVVGVVAVVLVVAILGASLLKLGPTGATNMLLDKVKAIITIDPSGGTVTLQLPLQDIFRGSSIDSANGGTATFTGTLLDPSGASLNIAGQLSCG